MSTLSIQIDDISHVLTDGIVLNDRFITQEQFKDEFVEMLRNLKSQPERLAEFQQLLNAVRATKTWTNKKGQVQTIDVFVNNLEQLATYFTTYIMPGLGGNISLLTAFNFGDSPEQEVYYLMQESDLPSQIEMETGAKIYSNTQDTLRNLLDVGKDMVKLDGALNQHLQMFASQVNDSKLQTAQQRQEMYTWASYNMRERWKIFRERKRNAPVSLGKYFWGKTGKKHGYITEAYGTHLALHHQEVLLQSRAKSIVHEVIEEEGGLDAPNSYNLYSLLASTKGNTMSQSSGDIVVVDGEGRLKFNIQSKASRGHSYEFTIRYQQFLRAAQQFVTISERILHSNERDVNQSDVDAIFNAFKTSAWVPTVNTLNEKLHQELKKK